MNLPDPRRHPAPNLRNPAIRLAMAQLDASSREDVTEAAAALSLALSELLLARDHAALNAALTQAPSVEIAQTLWQTLRKLTEAPAPLNVFLIPVILVAGVKGSATLPGQLTDPAAIIALLRRHELVSAAAPIWLASELVTADELASVSPARLMHWREDPHIAERGLPITLSPAAMQLRDEAVFLRYVVGATSAPVHFNGKVGAWGLPLADLIGKQLATAGVTLFTIPRAPQGWLSALESGRNTLMETRLQHMASNAIRGIRLKGRTPIASIAAHESEEIRITVSNLEDGERWQGFVWPLGPRDDIAAIERYAIELFAECQVDDIRVVPDIQPDLEGDLPFFVTAHTAPVQPA